MKKLKNYLPMIFLWTLLCLPSCGSGKEEIVIGQSGEVSETENQEAAEKEEEKTEDSDDGRESPSGIWVDVGGAVKNPGVYTLEENARVFQAIEAAGGFTEEADTQYLNQAATVSDGEKILVYTREETQALKEQGVLSDQTAKGNGEAESGKVNINQASLEELQTIPGIGEVRAQAIIDYREETGGFGSIEDIQQVSGIKGKTFEKIEAYITVE